MLQSAADIKTDWDVLIVGGAMSGAATALELLRRNQKLRVLIVESNPAHDRRVGESTVEVSSYFLARVLGLSGELNRNHIQKQGLRLWFANGRTQSIADCSELGPKFNVLFPGYQIDRSRLDEVVLQKAVARGAALLRPAKIKDVILCPGQHQRILVETPDFTEEVKARWVVDASGVRALLARKQGWLKKNERHPVSAVWSRWKGVLDWDDSSLAEEFPQWSARVFGVRNNATNHLMGRGWWAWWILLKDGDVSIGVVYDERLVTLKEGSGLGERLKSMLCEHPAGERLLRHADYIPGDVFYRGHFACYSKQFAGDGFVLVGDAAGFLDPFYSPGLDWVCYTVMAGSKLIAEAFEEVPDEDKLDSYNQMFAHSYERWFKSLYLDKYYYLGDFELMNLAFRLDLALYYLGVVSRPYLLGREALTIPSFGQKEAKWPAWLMSFYNRRLAAIARKRMRSGRWGRKNDRKFGGFFNYRLNWTLPLRLGVVCIQFFLLELVESLANLGRSHSTLSKKQRGAKGK